PGIAAIGFPDPLALRGIGQGMVQQGEIYRGRRLARSERAEQPVDRLAQPDRLAEQRVRLLPMRLRPMPGLLDRLGRQAYRAREPAQQILDPAEALARRRAAA